jgi:dTDP-glucose 4,6-dehydratase
MKILVTGGAGFIGSNFIRHILMKYSTYKVINFDALTYAGNLNSLRDVENNNNYLFINGDIKNKKLVNDILRTYKVDVIVNFAAESHVDKSINSPQIFIETNVLGTLTLLESARNNNISKFIQISTDEVYGSLGKEGFFTETTPLAPNSPYSSSKAGADLLVYSYFKTYGMDINITRCSNNYGPFQFPEKLIPLMITNALENKILPIYGDGENIRDWLHVKDHCYAIDIVMHKGVAGEVYNIGGNNEFTNNQIVNFIIDELKVSRELVSYVKDRIGHDRRYAIDSQKIVTKLGWQPKYLFKRGLSETIDWYKQNKSWWQPLK